MQYVPVQTTVGEVDELEKLDLFVFSFQIVCVPDSEFVIVQPSRHFLREQQYGGSSRFFQIVIADTFVTTVLRMLSSDSM
jgi:hypothetical protein